MNQGQIRTRILRALNDDPRQPVYFDPLAMNQAIQDAAEILCEEAPLYSAIYTLPRREGTMLYTIEGVGARILCPWRFWLPDLQRPLAPCELTDLDARHERWMEITGDPYYWFPVDWRTFGVWPVPAQGGGWMEVDCYVWPARLASDSDEFRALDQASHELLVFYGEAEGYMRQWDVGRALDLWASFAGGNNMVRFGADMRAMTEKLFVRAERPYQGRQGI